VIDRVFSATWTSLLSPLEMLSAFEISIRQNRNTRAKAHSSTGLEQQVTLFRDNWSRSAELGGLFEFDVILFPAISAFVNEIVTKMKITVTEGEGIFAFVCSIPNLIYSLLIIGQPWMIDFSISTL
jgi:hypothetical protein